MKCGLKKTKFMFIDTGKEPEEATEERVKEGVVPGTCIYKYRDGNQQIRKLEKSYTRVK